MTFGLALGAIVGITFLSINAIVLNLRRNKW